MIHWYINEQQADYIFKCLGQRPFVEVNALIQDLYNQANPPANPAPTAEEQKQWMAEQFAKKANGLVPHELHGPIGSVEEQQAGGGFVPTRPPG